MSHLHSCHSRLPKGICIDYSIENHERRYLQCKNDLLLETEAIISSDVTCREKQNDTLEKTQDIRSVSKENKADTTTYKPEVTGIDIQTTESDRCSSISDTDVEPSSSSSILAEGNISTPASETDNNAKGSTNISATKTCRRKSRKPSHVVSDTGCSEIIGTDDYNWVEIVAATQPMIARCPHCTFTCNTELQLKVQFLTCLQTLVLPCW